MTFKNFCETNKIKRLAHEQGEEASHEIYHNGTVVMEIEDHADFNGEKFSQLIKGLKEDLNYGGGDIEGDFWWAASPVPELVSFLETFDENGEKIRKEVESLSSTKKSIWKRLFGGK